MQFCSLLLATCACEWLGEVGWRTFKRGGAAVWTRWDRGLSSGLGEVGQSSDEACQGWPRWAGTERETWTGLWWLDWRWLGDRAGTDSFCKYEIS